MLTVYNEENVNHGGHFIEDDNDAVVADNYFILEVANHDHVY